MVNTFKFIKNQTISSLTIYFNWWAMVWCFPFRYFWCVLWGGIFRCLRLGLQMWCRCVYYGCFPFRCCWCVLWGGMFCYLRVGLEMCC